MNWGCALRAHIDCGSIGANADLSYVPISSPAPSSSAPLYIGIGGDESRALPLAQEALDLVTSFARVWTTSRPSDVSVASATVGDIVKVTGALWKNPNWKMEEEEDVTEPMQEEEGVRRRTCGC